MAALLGTAASPLGWQADIVHANDWPCGLAPLYLHHARQAGSGPIARSVMTIHNLAFQGVFPMASADLLDLPDAARGIAGAEFWGQLSMLKAGLQAADAITTVSPTYAREIQRPELGFGLDGVLRSRSEHLHGLLNGIDTAVWNPRTDPLIAARYGADDLAAKARNRAALRQRLGLPETKQPLLGLVGRLTPQKGVDLVAAGAPRLLAQGAQLVVLGKGDAALEASLAQLARAHPQQVHVTLGFDETLAHQIEAGADCFLMPSRFEPCGLNQMYSQAYGTPPVVTATGAWRTRSSTSSSPRTAARASSCPRPRRPPSMRPWMPCCASGAPPKPGRPCSGAGCKRISGGTRRHGNTSPCMKPCSERPAPSI